ncbi:DUF262 domain-containing protein [Chitinivorax sp. PXF-14]|uniref:DUF262 domain-containing protein n=1 Tax=Chitinivorax sp. PXF-14 TaxID=3230488 RepID=UPI0034651EDE
MNFSAMDHDDEVPASEKDEESISDDPPEIEGIEPETTGNSTWENKARQLMRQIVTQKVDLPISKLAAMIDDGEIDLAPTFQRRLRWTRSQQSRLIESVIMNVPIPPVFLGEYEPGKYLVLDGRQRLTALYEYLTGNFKLSGLEVWTELVGKKFSNLQKMHVQGLSSPAQAITRRFVPAVLILHESVPEVKYEVFDRLNTGGVIAEPMEVRNAIYYGPFNKLLHEASELEEFRRLWGIPLDTKGRERNGIYKRMADLEMVLRFFAFQDYKKFDGSLKVFLNNFMSKRNEEYTTNKTLLDKDHELFLETMKRVLFLLGDKALHRPISKDSVSKFPSAPYADAILYTVSKLSNEQITEKNGLKIRETLCNLCLNDKAFVKSITVGTNARTAADYRIETVVNAILVKQ